MTWFRHLRTPAGLERVARALVYALIVLTPLFFLPFTLDPLEINKQTLLVLLTLSASLAWLGSMHAARTVSFRRGWLNAAPLLFLFAVGVSASISHAPYLSWIGTVGQQYTSGLSVLCYVAIFYLTANLFDAPVRHAGLYTAILGSAALTGLIGLLGLFNIVIPGLAQGGAMNTVGTANALGVFLAAAAVLGNARWIAGHTRAHHGTPERLNQVLVFLVSLMALAFLILLDYWVLWVVFLAGLLALFVFVLVRAGEFPDVGRLSLPAFLAAFSILFLFWLPSPVRVNVPVEVTPSFSGSWSVMMQTVRAQPFFGTGPGTFTFDYAHARPAEVNATSFWNVRFDRPASFFLLIPTTFGLAGAVGWVLLVLWLLIAAVGRLLQAKGDEWLPTFVAFGGWFTLLVAFGLYSADVSLLVLFFLLSGVLAAQVTAPPHGRPFGQSPRVGLLLSFAFVLISVGAVTLIFVAGQRYVAETAFAQAVRLDQAKGELDTIITLLDRAATVNRFDDVYYRNLAQALLLKVGQQINGVKDPSALKPEDRQRIKDLTAAAVNASVRATELSPDNALNWMQRGSVYRQLVPVVGGSAGDLAVAALTEAAKLEPTNPENVTNLGQAYLAIAEYNRPLVTAADAAAKKDAQAKVDANDALAEQEFNKAVDLKGDYSPAHYQLAVLKEQEGKLDDAIGKMEEVQQYNQQDVGVAFELGVLYLRRGGKDDLTRAQMALEYAVQLLPSYSNARWFLASIYEQQGKVDKAIEQIQKVSELNPGNDLVAARLQRLKDGTDAKAPLAPLDGSSSATSVPVGQPTVPPKKK